MYETARSVHPPLIEMKLALSSSKITCHHLDRFNETIAIFITVYVRCSNYL